MSVENVILTNLVYNEEYSRKVIPFIKQEYFSDVAEKVVFTIIDDYVKKYNNFPSQEALAIELTNSEGMNESTFISSKDIIQNMKPDEMTSLDWLLDSTEKFCQEKALYNAIMKSIEIIDDKKSVNSKGAIPQILSDALAVSFDTHIGHDFLEDFSSRYEFYHAVESRIAFDIEYFNLITKGGLPKKTLNILLAGTGVGKSLFMCHMAAANLMAGLNVLYITMEMAEERIAERIEANLLDITVDDLKNLPKEMHERKLLRIKSKSTGKLIIKEYPTACAGSANFRHLINDLRIKKNFIPDIVYIDYLNICISSRIKAGANVNSYTVIKSIAEELRGLAVEFNVPVVSATQTTRSGFSNSDVGLEDTSESFGLPATADFMVALITSEELAEMNQIMVKQLKNRYGDPNFNKRFVVGVDRSKMKLYDVENSAQDLVDDRPIMDKTGFGQEDFERSKPKSKFDRSKFDGFS